MPNVRIRFVGDVAASAVVVSERGDVLTSLTGFDGRPVADTLIAAAPALADLGRSDEAWIDRERCRTI
jgi:hypothetical protein